MVYNVYERVITMVERKEYLDFLIKLKDLNIIKVVTGIRRCGKSTLFELYKKYLLDNGVEESQIISMNFEEPKYLKLGNWENLYNDIEARLLKDKMNYISVLITRSVLLFESKQALL